MKKTLLLAAGCLAALMLEAAPIPPEQLQLSVTIELAADLGLPASSTFNPRFFDGFDYVNQVNLGAMGFGRYPSGSPIAQMLVTNAPLVLEHRMVAPFRGALRSTYILGSSMGASPGNTTFSRYDFDGMNRVDATTPNSQSAEGFDWVDEDTIVYTVYNPSTSRKRLYLVDVTAEPFSLAANPAWAGGYITTSVGTRIRNVRVGDVYSGYAYYGDGNQNSNPNFYAVNLATGAETLLGNAGTLTGTGSYGIWTVLERGGYLYVQTTDNGIQVYSMSGPTTLGSLYTTYDKATLNAVTGYTGAQFYGLDVTPDGARMLLGASQGVVFELGAPILSIGLAGTELVLSWPKAVTAVAIQGAVNLSPPAFADLDPQPAPVQIDKFNTVQLPASDVLNFFRLRRTP